jgi:rhodanese-related sulfurtransferase
MRWAVTGFLLAFTLAAGSAAPAQSADETPEHLEGVTIVSAEELRPMLNQGVKVYDLRKKASYADGHVPGAMNAAEHYDSTKDALDTRFLGPNRSERIVFYSHGSTGWKSYHAARNAVEAGYDNVMWMRGGYQDWQAGDNPVAR